MTYEVRIEPLGETIEVNEGQTILDASLRAGIYLPHACGHGLCATCKIDLLEGDVDLGDYSPFALMDIEEAEGKVLACCATPTSDLVVEADIEDEPDAESHPLRSYTGVVTRIEQLTPRIKSIFLSIVDSDFEFQAGQYVNVSVPGVDGARAFSIANPPSERNLVELNVALVPGGQATEYLHNDLACGDELNFVGPFGRFHVRTSFPEPMLFLAGGSGLSSPKSMLLDLFEKGETRDIKLIYGARNQDELYYRALFEELAREHGNFEYIPALSDEPEDSDWQGLRGFVHEAAIQRFEGSFAGLKAYMCGPPPMVDACVTALMRGRLFEKDMYMENFFNNSSRAATTKSPLFKSI